MSVVLVLSCCCKTPVAHTHWTAPRGPAAEVGPFPSTCTSYYQDTLLRGRQQGQPDLTQGLSLVFLFPTSNILQACIMICPTNKSKEKLLFVCQ